MALNIPRPTPLEDVAISLLLWRTPDGAYVVREGDQPNGREVAELRPDGTGWWATRHLPSGRGRTMWQPNTAEEEAAAARIVAERLLRT